MMDGTTDRKIEVMTESGQFDTGIAAWLTAIVSTRCGLTFVGSAVKSLRRHERLGQKFGRINRCIGSVFMWYERCEYIEDEYFL